MDTLDEMISDKRIDEVKKGNVEVYSLEQVAQQLFNKIKDLENGIFTNDKSLKGKFRKRAGNYRIVYLKENDILLITVIRLAHR